EPPHNFATHRKVHSPQDRTKHKPHEEIDACPQQAGKHVNEIQQPKIASKDGGDHRGDGCQRPPEVTPGNEALGCFDCSDRHPMLTPSSTAATRPTARAAEKPGPDFSGYRPPCSRFRSNLSETHPSSCPRPRPADH